MSDLLNASLINNSLGEGEEFFENKNRNLKIITIQNYKIIEKASNLHEAFINLYCINKMRKEIPNFSYCFGYDFNKKLVYTEMVEGKTFKEWILSPDFNFRSFLEILIQILFTLQVAQRKFSFVHYDLTPWNIILKKVKRREVRYYMDEKCYYTVNTNLIPIIIDTGRSHIVYQKYHY